VSLSVLSPREASIFACLCDTFVAPADGLPPVRETDAVTFFDSWLARAPRLNRVGLRAMLYATELLPVAAGKRRRLRALDERGRAAALDAFERSRHSEVRQILRVLKGMAFLSYYGDDSVMGLLGYDADANVARGRELRRLEGRP